MLVGLGVWWGLSGQESALLVGAAISLIGLGSYGEAKRALKKKNGDE
jgi:hypothetical protein